MSQRERTARNFFSLNMTCDKHYSSIPTFREIELRLMEGLPAHADAFELSMERKDLYSDLFPSMAQRCVQAGKA